MWFAIAMLVITKGYTLWSNSQSAMENHGKSAFWIGKSSISMAFVNSYIKLPESTCDLYGDILWEESSSGRCSFVGIHPYEIQRIGGFQFSLNKLYKHCGSWTHWIWKITSSRRFTKDATVVKYKSVIYIIYIFLSLYIYISLNWFKGQCTMMYNVQLKSL